MEWAPHVTVAAIIEKNGRFLLVEELSEGRMVINQPAGHLDEGESLVEAVSREAREETGLPFTPTALIGIYRWVSPLNETYLRICFTGTCDDSAVPGSLDRGILRTVWLSRNEVYARNDIARSPLVLRCIDDYIQGKRYPLDLCNEISEL
jgi:8-oxo-dGTP pyrophosphatase MutT (NUDIX family)